jgi:hypothetical protein
VSRHGQSLAEAVGDAGFGGFLGFSGNFGFGEGIWGYFVCSHS